MKVGSLCECISSDWINHNSEDVIFPVKDVIYTVRSITELSIGVYIRLEEIINHTVRNGVEPDFDIEGFRELQPPLNLSELIESCNTQTV